jgi:tetratricopeptide (TPR) repeat protein
LREAYQRTKGPYDPETLDVVNDLACVYNEQGNVATGAGRRSEAEAKYAQAEQLLLVIVDALEQRMGPEHPATLIAKGNLADSYYRQGRLAEAMKLRKEVLAAQRRVLGNQHPNTLYTMVALAEIERDQQSLKEAASHLEEAVKGCRSALDRNHETVDAALAILADVYIRQREFEKVGPVLTEAREITLYRWGPDHDLTCGANQAVAAYLLFVRKDHAKAEPYLRDSLRHLDKNHPEDPGRLIIESRLGYSLLMQKKYPEAKQHLLSAYSGTRAREKTIPPEQNAELANIVRWTAQLYHESAASRDDKDYDLIRSDPGFQAIVLDLGFPADPFAPREKR